MPRITARGQYVIKLFPEFHMMFRYLHPLVHPSTPPHLKSPPIILPALVDFLDLLAVDSLWIGEDLPGIKTRLNS
jgi:hypothetical protein